MQGTQFRLHCLVSDAKYWELWYNFCKNFILFLLGCGYGIGVGGSVFTREDSCYQRSSRGEESLHKELLFSYLTLVSWFCADYTTGEIGEWDEEENQEWQFGP